jgi:hypothetical protein
MHVPTLQHVSALKHSCSKCYGHSNVYTIHKHMQLRHAAHLYMLK